MICRGRAWNRTREEMHRLLCQLKPLDKRPLNLFLVAHLGDLTVPWQIVEMIREVVDLFNVIIPPQGARPCHDDRPGR